MNGFNLPFVLRWLHCHWRRRYQRRWRLPGVNYQTATLPTPPLCCCCCRSFQMYKSVKFTQGKWNWWIDGGRMQISPMKRIDVRRFVGAWLCRRSSGNRSQQQQQQQHQQHQQQHQRQPQSSLINNQFFKFIFPIFQLPQICQFFKIFKIFKFFPNFTKFPISPIFLYFSIFPIFPIPPNFQHFSISPNFPISSNFQIFQTFPNFPNFSNLRFSPIDHFMTRILEIDKFSRLVECVPRFEIGSMD